MLLYFETPLLDGVLPELLPELNLTRTDDPSRADVRVTLALTDPDTVAVMLANGCAALTGHTVNRLCRALGLLAQALHEDKSAYEITETPLFTLDGAMVDMSRDAVMNVATVKWMLRRMALMGLNTYMLYTEDTYEVPERPYFGYMRGRYTMDELRELDAYARKYSIEMIPCIQLLGHLATHLRWSSAAAYRDTQNVLLVGEDVTYRFIDDLLRTVSACFTSRRIHIGCDETHDLGTGRYLDLHGYRDRADVFLEHLSRIAEMAKSYGLRPMMWSDMFFRLSGRNLEHFRDYDPRTELLPEIENRTAGMQQVFWDYYNPDEEFYRVNLEKHDRFPGETMFAGGIWAWGGFTVQYNRTLCNSLPALEACRKHGTREVIATIWHNGAECSLVLALAGLQMYAEYDYRSRYDKDEVAARFRICGGAEYTDFLTIERLEHPDGGDEHGIARAILYNDPLTGLIDAHLRGLDTRAYYGELRRDFAAGVLKDAGLCERMYRPAFDVARRLTDVLELKADLGVRLTDAYRRGDRDALADLCDLCPELTARLKALREAHRASWEVYNKPFGWEVHDLRYGALLMRMDTLEHRLADYLAGRVDALPELAAERLRVDGKPDGAPNEIDWLQFSSLFTANRI